MARQKQIKATPRSPLPPPPPEKKKGERTNYISSYTVVEKNNSLLPQFPLQSAYMLTENWRENSSIKKKKHLPQRLRSYKTNNFSQSLVK